MTFHGKAKIRLPIYQQSSAHREFFLLTADWLVQNQGQNGGWAVPVAREVSGIKKVLQAGWLSAMVSNNLVFLKFKTCLKCNILRFIKCGNLKYYFFKK